MNRAHSGRGFCPRCGDSVPERDTPLPGEPRDRKAALCDACFFDDFELVNAPDRVEIDVCSGCGAVRQGDRWVDIGARDYTDVAVETVRESLGIHVDADEVQWGVRPEQVDETTIRMHCSFSGVIRETPVEESVTLPVKIGQGTCDRCGRIAGGAYAATVQVRADGRTPDPEERREAVEIARDLVENRETEGDREAFISEVRETPDGPDVKLSTTELGRAVATRITDRFGGAFTDSATLVTEDGDGNEVYRVAFAVRLPRYRPGDIIDPDDGGGPVLVRSVRGNLKGVRLVSGDSYETMPSDLAESATRLGTYADASETTLVALEDEHAVQVLDPETFEAKTVPRPEYLDPDAETVPVIKHREGIHILPSEY